MTKYRRLEVSKRHSIAQLLECYLVHMDGTPTPRSANLSPVAGDADLPVFDWWGLYFGEQVLGNALAIREHGHSVARLVCYPRIIQLGIRTRWLWLLLGPLK
ncbi:hypothetical protein A2U01_0056721, partial [Trifolium medium]|nr:hypothetical protein [Trifolium medium]